jgi:hypothetical protein
MAKPVVTSYSRVFPAQPEKAFDAVLPTPLPELFHRRYGPIPPIKSVEGQNGVWGTVGQTRTIHTGDGGSMREELTRVDGPNAFGYTITDLTGPMKPLVSTVQGLWSFDAVDGGTRITWQWTITPKSALTAPLMGIFCSLWRKYADRSFDEIGRIVSA